MRILLDTNVALDLLLERPGFATAAQAIWLAIEQKRCDGYVSTITPVNIYYVVRKERGSEAARDAVATLLAEVDVCSITKAGLQLALKSPITDYEDAVQHACAVQENLDIIVTRNLSDYRYASIRALSPTDFLAELNNNLLTGAS